MLRKTGVTFLAAAVLASLTGTGVAFEKSADQKDGMVTSNQIVGASLYNADKEAIASVDDIVLDRKGQVHYLIAGVGGFVGVGQSQVAIPAKAVSCQTKMVDGEQTYHMAISMTQEKLGKAPKLETDDRSELTNANWVSQNNSYFSQDTVDNAPEAQKLLCFGKLNDITAKCSAGNEFGQVDDIVFDTKNHQAKYVVLGKGGTLSVGESYTAVPFTAVTFNNNKDKAWTAKLSQSGNVLKTLPKVTSPDYPELQNENVREVIEESFE